MEEIELCVNGMELGIAILQTQEKKNRMALQQIEELEICCVTISVTIRS
jgi:hypothetical protein